MWYIKSYWLNNIFSIRNSGGGETAYSFSPSETGNCMFHLKTTSHWFFSNSLSKWRDRGVCAVLNPIKNTYHFFLIFFSYLKCHNYDSELNETICELHIKNVFNIVSLSEDWQEMCYFLFLGILQVLNHTSLVCEMVLIEIGYFSIKNLFCDSCLNKVKQVLSL